MNRAGLARARHRTCRAELESGKNTRAFGWVSDRLACIAASPRSARLSHFGASGGSTRPDRPRVTTLPFTREVFPCAERLYLPLAGCPTRPTPPPPPIVCLLVLFSPCPPSRLQDSTGVQRGSSSRNAPLGCTAAPCITHASLAFSILSALSKEPTRMLPFAISYRSF
jgi:hypothetical protein